MLGRLTSQLLGRLLARLYELRAVPEAAEEPSEEARRNLAVLSECLARMERDDLPGALLSLEGLTGRCREAAGDFMGTARPALSSLADRGLAPYIVIFRIFHKCI